MTRPMSFRFRPPLPRPAALPREATGGRQSACISSYGTLPDKPCSVRLERQRKMWRK